MHPETVGLNPSHSFTKTKKSKMKNELITINFGKGASLKVTPLTVTILPEGEIKDNYVIMVTVRGESTPIIISPTEYRRVLEIKEQIKIKENKMIEKPKEPTPAELEVILMPNGEIVCHGKTVGWYKTHKQYLHEKKGN